MNALEAWIGINLGINPLELVSVSGMWTWTRYIHPKANMVFINENDLFTEETTKYGKGFTNSKFDVFQQAYEGKGKRPCIFHPILRAFYKKGLKARTKWDS